MNNRTNKANTDATLSKREREDVEQRLRPRVPMLYEIIRKEGETELSRPLSGLWWSGIAAGLCIGFSMVSEGFLRGALPDVLWRPLIDNFGYSVGFLIVILGRQQLFTENTLTAVLPVMAVKSRANLVCMLRLWGVVLAANLVGAFLFALFCSKTGLFVPAVETAFREMAQHLTEIDPVDTFWRGIVAGWLIAVLVWMLPNSKGGEFMVIVLITYLIALGDFTHVIAGSVEAFWLLIDGGLSVGHVLGGFLLPTLLGNVVGGSVLFAMLSYVQVHDEI
jgi:formate/nitrite transporter FocA (FNT family)